MNKVIVIGCPGSGKTTFAEKLNKITGLPLYYLDAIWHKPDKTHIPREEFDERITEIFAAPQWIIDGNYKRTIELRLRECDTVFLFDLPTDVCLQGVRDRIGKERYDLPWLEKELDDEFRQLIVDFPEDTLPYIYELLEKHKEGRQIVIFKSRTEADRHIEALSLGGITFEYLDKAFFPATAPELYSILDSNMKKIASYEDNYSLWFENVSEGLLHEQRQIVIIKNGSETVGFFQYYANDDTFMMEEIQFKPEYHGKGIFRALYGYVLSFIKDSIKNVEAYTHRENCKSMAILDKMGLSEGEKSTENFCHFRGSYSDFQKWFKGE